MIARPESPLRILLVSEDVPGWGGLAKHVLTLASALDAAGHSVTLLGSAELQWDAVTDKLAAKIPFIAELKGHKRGWKESAIGAFNPLRRSIVARKFAKAIAVNSIGFDVVHYHGHLPNIGAFLPRSVNFVQTRHDQGSDCLTHVRFRNGAPCTETNPAACASCAGEGFVQSWLSTLAVRTYRNEVNQAFVRHKVIFVSEFLKARAAKTLPAAENGHVVHNFLSEEAVTLLSCRASQNDSPHDRPFVLLASMLTDYKGVLPFLQALKFAGTPQVDVVIAGGGPLEQQIRNDFGEPWLTILGWSDSRIVARYMQNCMTLVVTSLCDEPCATSVLEGLAAGVPVFAINQGGTPELTRYEQYDGQLCLFDSLEELSRAIYGLVVKGHSAVSSQIAATVDNQLPALLAIYREDARR